MTAIIDETDQVERIEVEGGQGMMLNEESCGPVYTIDAPEKILHVLRDRYESIDSEMVVVTLSLFVFAILVLSPRGSFRGISLWRRRANNADSHHATLSPRSSRLALNSEGEEEGALSSVRTATTVNSIYDPEDETEEEAFEKLWPAIRASGYRRLVLPPECKLVVDIPAFRKRLQNQEGTKNERRKMEHDDDHPLTRLNNYRNHLLILLRNFLSYDFVSTGWMIMSCIQAWLRLKSRKPHELLPEDDDDDASEVSHTKAGTRIETTLEEDSGSMIHPFRSRHNSDSSKQESEFGSEYGSVMGDENDDGKWLSNSPTTASRRTSAKKKDALSSYRSMGPSVGVSLGADSLSIPLKSATSDEVNNRQPKLPNQNLNSPADDVKQPQVQTQDFTTPGDRPPKLRMESKDMSFFDAAHSTASLRKLHVDVPVPDKNGYILGDDFLPSCNQTPLLVFVNSRSGPQQGSLLIGQLRRLLNPIQVWDLADGSPEKVLESFCTMTRLRILVCGGDGTVSWIISCLEKAKVERWPPIAILPLGTGNDLARIHGWGGGYNNESLISILEQVAESYISLLDRWEMKIETKKGKIPTVKSFFNYVGVGSDAQAALQFHMLRESKPQLFFSRVFNKMWYLLFGAEEAIKESNINLSNEIVLIADGIVVPLPPDSQGIIILNIDSYTGGVPIWSHGVKDDHRSMKLGNKSANNSPNSIGWTPKQSTDEEYDIPGSLSPRRVRSMGHLQSNCFFPRIDSCDDFLAESEEEKIDHIFSCDRPSSCQDGLLDIVSVRGTYHLGQIRVGLSNASRICQAHEIKIISKKKVAVQLDGEPWRQSACTMTITRKKEPAVMLHRSADDSGGVETEMAKLLDWAEDRRIIDRNVHSILMKEFSRRIENKTRQRRVQSQDNLMLSLKRAIARGGNHGSHPTFPGTLSF